MWLTLRRGEHDALSTIIDTLSDQDTARPVTDPGVAAHEELDQTTRAEEA